MKPAVSKVIRYSERELTERFQHLVTHYGFEPMFARPATGHDKGGVESRGKAIRLQHLVPIPSAETLEQMNAKLLSRIDSRFDANKYDDDKRHMLPLGERSFDAAKILYVTASRSSLVRIECAYYSVPSRYACLEIEAHVCSSEIRLFYGEQIAIHRRIAVGKSVNYRHFLRELSRKPNAVRQVAKELLHQFGNPFDAFWHRLVMLHGAHRAARLFSEVLALVESAGEENVRAQIQKSLDRGILPEDGMKNILREELVVRKDLREIHVESSSTEEFDSLLEVAQ